MGGFSNLVTIVGLILIVALLLLLFCRYLGGWTKTRTWFTSTREEKMVLTRGGMTGHFNPNGYMIPSDSDLNLSGGGSFRRFDKTDADLSLGNNPRQTGGIPPQPLRPAPIPPGPILSQSSVDSVFAAPGSPLPTPPKLPPPPQTNFRTNTFPTLSSTNPFLPLLQASTQFFSQTMANFQPGTQTQQSNHTGSSGSGSDSAFHGSSNYYTPGQQVVSSISSGSSSSNSTRGGRISMGELLFSAPPIYPVPDTYTYPNPYAPQTAEPLSQLPAPARGVPTDQNPPSAQQPYPTPPEKKDAEPDLLSHQELEPTPNYAGMTTKSLVESMRAEIRLENEKIQDATKSLMEEDDSEGKRSVKSTSDFPEPVEPQVTTSLLPNPRVLGGERKFSAPEIGILERQVLGPAVPAPVPSSSGGYRSRSFSLRQASVESIGDTSDLGSPDGSAGSLPFLQRAMSCDSVCSDTSVVLGDLDTPHVTGHLCVGMEYDKFLVKDSKQD